VFAENLPKAIKDRLDELNGEHSKDEKERQKRLRDRLRDFFGRPYKATKNGDKPVLPTETPGATPRDIGETREPRGGTGKPKPKTGRRTGFGDHPSTDEDNPKGAQYPQHPRQEIDVQWVAPEFEDRPGILAHWVGGASRVLQMNSDHPLLLALIHDAQVGRQASKRDEVAKISREAIADHLVATILAAEMFVRSDLTAGQATLSKKFVDNAVTDETLTALCLDVPAMAHLISQRFKGRAGFRASVDEAA